MKKPLASTVATLCVGIGLLSGTAFGQAGSTEAPHRVGLIDMAHVFKNYEKFKTLREGLQEEVKVVAAKAQKLQQQMAAKAEELKEFKQGSDQHAAVENELLRLKSEMELLRDGTQRDLARKESQIYRTIYLEVSDTVALYAKHFDYTLVLRYNRSGLDVDNEPQAIIQELNRLVVFSREGDDITQPVLDYLNKKYDSGSTAARGN